MPLLFSLLPHPFQLQVYWKCHCPKSNDQALMFLHVELRVESHGPGIRRGFRRDRRPPSARLTGKGRGTRPCHLQSMEAIGRQKPLNNLLQHPFRCDRHEKYTCSSDRCRLQQGSFLQGVRNRRSLCLAQSFQHPGSFGRPSCCSLGRDHGSTDFVAIFPSPC